jgi:DNA polymerase I
MLYFLDAENNYAFNKIELLFYDDSDGSIFKFIDNTGYMPYLLTSYTADIYKIKCAKENHRYYPYEEVEKYNPFTQKSEKFLKIFAEKSYNINGERKNFGNNKKYGESSLSEFLDDNKDIGVRSFENKIKYSSSYVADNGLVPGMPYLIEKVNKKTYNIKRCVCKDNNGKVCNSKYSMERWGYNIDDQDEGKLTLLSIICEDCLSLLYSNNDIPDEKREYIHDLSRLNDIEIQNKEIFYPILQNIVIKKEITDELIELFKNEKFEQESLPEWNQYFFNEIPNINRVAFDIEVLPKDRHSFPTPEKAERPVISVSFVDNQGNSTVYVLKSGYKDEGIRKSEINQNVTILEFDDEKELIRNTFDYLIKYPIVISFNGDKFDLHYLYNRALKLGGFIDKKKNKIKVKVKKDELNKDKEEEIVYELPISFENKRVVVFGKTMVETPIFYFINNNIHIDISWFFAKPPIKTYAFSKAYENNSLDEISKGLLKKKKVSVDIVDVNGKKKFIGDYTKWELIYYNLVDSQLTIELTSYNNNLLINLIFFLMRISKTGINELIHNEISNWIKNMIYWYHRKFNYLIPRRESIQSHNYSYTSSSTKGKGYQGAYVKPPIPGIHFDVSLMDFSSLYPSIIKLRNLSYETLDVCDHEDCKQNLVPSTDHYVCKKVVGIFSFVVGIIRDYRVYYFKKKSEDKKLDVSLVLLYKVIQQALKVFINGSYGVFGSPQFPMYCLPVAESTTAIGRFSIISVISEIENTLKKEVINGDTDSVFIHKATDKDIEYIIDYAYKNMGLEIALESKFRMVSASTRKKAYIALPLNKNEKVMIKSFSGKKKNTPIFIRNGFEELVNYINKNIDNENDIKNIKLIFRQGISKIIDNINNNMISYEDMSYQQTIGKSNYTSIPQHVRAARMIVENHLDSYLNKSKIEEENKNEVGNDDSKDGIVEEDNEEDEIIPLGCGDSVEYVKVKSIDGVMPLELINKGQIVTIDKDKYRDNVKSVFSQLLDCFDIDFDELLVVKKQSNLTGFI